MDDTNKVKYQTIDEYILRCPEENRAVLTKIHQIIKQAAPKAEERMSWQMPTYHQNENLVHFALQKNHIGFYPSPQGIEKFAKELAGYKTSKGAVQFPLKDEIPYDLIEKITKFRVSQIEGK